MTKWLEIRILHYYNGLENRIERGTIVMKKIKNVEPYFALLFGTYVLSRIMYQMIKAVFHIAIQVYALITGETVSNGSILFIGNFLNIDPFIPVLS